MNNWLLDIKKRNHILVSGQGLTKEARINGNVLSFEAFSHLGNERPFVVMAQQSYSRWYSNGTFPRS
jgi:hypothetical protein